MFVLGSVLLGAAGVLGQPGVMNSGGIPYQISNPPGSTAGWVGLPGNYSVDFNTNVKGTVEHFDVYGEVRTRYSQVYWTRNTNINLPDALIKRFAGKVMAITGYEIDQVTHSGPQPGSTTKASSVCCSVWRGRARARRGLTSASCRGRLSKEGAPHARSSGGGSSPTRPPAPSVFARALRHHAPPH